MSSEFNHLSNPSIKPTLNLIEIFASIQGETSLTGLPTSFIRLAACNLRCSWCDTPYSFGKGKPYSIEEILQTVELQGCKHVCVTGGEPLLQQNVHLLIKELCERDYIVSLETGGSLSIAKVDPRVHIILDIKCPGSKMSHRNDWSNLQILRQHDEVKFVLLNEQDYIYAKEICQKNQLFLKVKTVLFSPVFDNLEAKQLVQWILRDQLPVRLNMQIHKYIWSPDTKGV